MRFFQSQPAGALGLITCFTAAMVLSCSWLSAAQAQSAIGATEPLADDHASPPITAGPPPGSVSGMGDINLFPKRIVMDSRQRIATVGLYNQTADQGDYEIEIIDMAMMPDGRLVNLDENVEPALKARVRTASQMLRWSPRRISLVGNDAQTIRIMARPPQDLADGEYRSHFLVVSVPPPEDVGFSIDQAVDGTSEKGIGVRIMPRFGISIPVIVRVGDTTLTTGLTAISLNDTPQGGKALNLTITRAGTRSAFGDFAIFGRNGGNPIATVKGVGVYPEVDSRQINIPIDPEADPLSYAPGSQLTIRYTDDDFEPGTILAEQAYIVP